jgi:serine/threonine protein kinase
VHEDTGVLGIGDRVAGFQVEGFLARGGMAVVYRARDLSLGRTVALKVIAPELAQDSKFRQRFTRESELAASIDHPNIIPIYAAGEENHLLYLVMRFVPGGNLGTVFKANGPLNAAEALPVFAQVARALDVAHSHFLVHRDVKPGNILLSGSGQPDRRHVYLSDFGLTKRLSTVSGVTTAGHFLGTLQYVAPEQVSNRTIDHRADIYSLGCVIFEAFAGEPPFVRDDQAALMYAHLTEMPPRIASRRAALPDALDDILQRALAKDPQDRYQNCDALLTDINSAFRAFDAAGLATVSFQEADRAVAEDSSDRLTTESDQARSLEFQDSTNQRAYATPSASTVVCTTPPLVNRESPARNQSRQQEIGRRASRPNKRLAFLVSLGALALAAAVALILIMAPRLKPGPSELSALPFELPRAERPLADDTMVWRGVDRGQWRIETIGVDGTPARTLRTGKQNRSVQLTPDRRTILYLRSEEDKDTEQDKDTLHAMSADGKEDRPLFSEGSAWCPQLSRPVMRNDLLVGFCAAYEGGPGTLNVMTLDGKLVRKLDEGRIGDPTLSRDGKSVVYWRSNENYRCGKGKAGDNCGGALQVIGIDGSGKGLLIAGADGELSDPAWSPTGDTLAYRQSRDGANMIMTVDVIGRRVTNRKPLTSGNSDSGPSWSPDGSRIAFLRARGEDSELRVIGADRTGGRPVRLYSEGYVANPIWTGQ